MNRIYPEIEINPRTSERRNAIKVRTKVESSSCYICLNISNLNKCKSCKKITCSFCLEKNYFF